MSDQHPMPVDVDSVPCRRDPELMFPKSNGDQRAQDDERAKAVCRRGNNGKACHVINRCLRYALRHNVDGIWAATTEDERKAIRDRTGSVPLPVIVSPYSMRAYEDRRNGVA